MQSNTLINYSLLAMLVLALLCIVALWYFSFMYGGLLGVLFLLIIAGIIGGGINALISDNGFMLPSPEPAGEGKAIIRPGFIGNIFIGITAAIVSWMLYGPFASACMMGCTLTQAPVTLTFAGFGGAVIIALGGARWLNAEVDKKMLLSAAIISQGSDNNQGAARAMEGASAAQVLQIAMENRPK
jgi:hypothetical protein